MDNLSNITVALRSVLLTPSTALIVSLAIGVILLWSPFQRAGRWVTTITAMILLFVATLPVASWITKPLETRFPPVRQLPESVTGIILLGGAFEPELTSDWGQPQV